VEIVFPSWIPNFKLFKLAHFDCHYATIFEVCIFVQFKLVLIAYELDGEIDYQLQDKRQVADLIHKYDS